MRKVSEILGRKGASAVVVTPDTKVIEALSIMAEKNIGSVLVMELQKEIIPGKLHLSIKAPWKQKSLRS